MSSLASRIAANKLKRAVEGTPSGELQPAARRGIQPVANREVVPEDTSVFTGAIRPSMPDLDADAFKTILDTKDKVAQRSRTGTPGYTHVSTLCSDVCPRHYAINVVHEREDWEAVTGGHRLMWAYGRTAEAHIRAHLTQGDVFGYQIYGDWRCPCKRTKHVGTKPKMDRLCPKCELPMTVYYEQPWRDHDNKIVGNPDLGAFIGRYYFPVEIKSMSKDLWDNLTKPLAEHVNQALLYRYLAKINGMMVHDKVMIVYAKKEFKWGSPYKVYVVDVTTPQYVGMLERSIELARNILRAIETRNMPKRLGNCTDIASGRSKRCPAAITCYNLPN